MAPTVLALGDYTVDQILGPLAALPGWGEETEVATFERRLGGNSGNFAAAAATLDLKVLCAGPIGADADGEWVKAELARIGADTLHLVAREGARTSLTIALVREDGERLFVTFPGALDDLARFVAEAPLPRADVVLFSGWCQPPRVGADALAKRIAEFQADGAKVGLDLAWSTRSWALRDQLFRLFGALDILLMNLDEARALVDTDVPEVALRRLRDRVGARPDIVVKCGADGAHALSASGQIVLAKPPPIKGPIAAVGAGDYFNAGLIAALYAERLSLDAALGFACDFAAHALVHGRDREVR